MREDNACFCVSHRKQAQGEAVPAPAAGPAQTSSTLINCSADDSLVIPQTVAGVTQGVAIFCNSCLYNDLVILAMLRTML